MASTHAVETIALNDNVSGLATDLGVSMLFIAPEAERISVTGTDQADLIMFSQMDDVFIVSGGGGVDRVVFAGDVDASRFTLTCLEEEGLLAVRDTTTGEAFFVSNDVEQLTIGGQTYDLEPLWA